MRIESLRDLLAQFPDIDGFWDFEDLEKTENRIREKLVVEDGAWNPQRVEHLSQLARVQGLRDRLPDAGATLLIAADLLIKHSNPVNKRAQVRFLIEQGRFFSLSMNSTQSRLHFSKAWEKAQELNEDYFKIEAAVLTSISNPPKFQNEWLQNALKTAEETSDPQSKLWLFYLYIMKGWHFFDFRKYEEALGSFEKALNSPRSATDNLQTIGVQWAIGRSQRALNRYEEALDLQMRLKTMMDRLGQTSGHISLEIAECLQLLKKPAEAQSYFESAYKELSLNGWYSDNKSMELSRIQHLSKKK